MTLRKRPAYGYRWIWELLKIIARNKAYLRILSHADFQEAIPVVVFTPAVKNASSYDNL
jgi:hypothetical protein